MKKIVLSYINHSMEQSFKSSALSLGSKLYYLIMINMIFDTFAYGLPNLIKNGEELSKKLLLIGMTILLIFLTLLGFLIRKYKKFLRYYSLGLILLYIVIIVEFSRGVEEGKIKIYLNALSINFLLSCMIYFNFPWLIYMIYNAIFNILIMSRLFEKEDWEPEKYLKIFFLIIMNGFVSYTIEKSNRESYLQLYNSNNFAQMFQTLINDVLPTPIIIRSIRNSSICFYNQAMFQMIKKEKQNEEEKSLFFDIYKKKENEEGLIKRIINNNLKTMKIMTMTEDEASLINSNNLISLLENFDKELAREQKELFAKNRNFLQKKIILPKREFSNIREQNLNIENTKEEEEEKYFDVKIQKINWQNEECLIIILNDITSIVSLAKFKDIDIYKNRLLATVSHDLRTPINGVMGMIETVSDNIIEKRDKKLLKIAVKFGHLLLSMINDILDFSKISNFQLSLNFEQVDILKLIKEVCSLIKFQIKNKGLEFHFEKKNIDHDYLFIKTDPNRLKQILLNLLSNALKFTFHGYIKLIIEITNENLLKISVKDTGIGIKQENIPKLFTLFGKLKQDDSNVNKQGVGLGLVISQNLAKLLFDSENNGIHVESTWQEGSEFWFYVAKMQNIEIEEIELEPFYDHINPLMSSEIRSNNNLIVRNNSPLRVLKDKSCSGNQKYSILIVDDDQINLMIAKEYMMHFDLSYIFANNGKEALNIVYEKVFIEHSRIDAILMDCNMPIMDGFTAAQKINEILLENKKPLIPVVALTANVSNVDIDFCFQAGMNYYLAKPVSRKDLSKLLSKILNIKLPY